MPEDTVSRSPAEANATTATAGPTADDPNTPAAPPGYELLDEIGQGGMGVVYRARDLAFDRDVAVKLLRDQFPADSTAARRFLDEARITGQLQHPGIPAAHQVGTLPDGRPFLAMKLIKGQTLAHQLRERSDSSASHSRFVAVFEQVCQAVGYAHAHGVVHRDLKPANVMVGTFGEVQVMDWGLVKVLSRTGASPSGPDPDATLGTEIRSARDEGEETQAGSLLGTPAYMPPEQAIGAVDQVDQRSDVFGLGGILCSILTGQPPYVGADSESTRQLAARARLDDAFRRLDVCGAEPELVVLCKQCLSVEKADRPADAGEVARAVAALRAAADERARRAELDRVRAEGELHAAELKALELRKRRQVQMALAVAIGLLVAGGLAAAGWHRLQTMQRQIEDQARDRVETERLARNADALSQLVGRCEGALRENDTDQVSAALEQIDRRMPEGGGEIVQDRAEQCRRDLAMLRDLDAIDVFRWTPFEGKYPDPEELADRWRAAFARYGVTPGETPTGQAAARLIGTPIRDRLLSALDLWLVYGRSPVVRELLRTADPDPFRDAVREAVAVRDSQRVIELSSRPEARSQPPGFTAAVGQIRAMPVETRRELLEDALQSRGDDLTVLMALGSLYPIGSPEGVDERLRWFQAAVAARPQSVAAHNSLGLALIDKGNPDGAVAAFRTAARIDPSYANAHYNLGSALRTRGDQEGSDAAFREAYRLNPKLVYPHFMLATVLRQSGNMDGAIAIYREAVRLAPNDARAHNELGAALKDNRDLDGAITAFREAIRLDPNYSLSYFNLGEILLKKKDNEGAASLFRAGIRIDPNRAAVHDSLGLALARMGDVDGALAASREAVRLDPKDAWAQNNLGELLRHKGDLKGAVAALREAVRLDPRYSVAHQNLGYALHLTGDRAGALLNFRKAVRLGSSNDMAHHNLALLLVEGPEGERDGREAVELATRACELTEWKQPTYILTLALAYAEDGDFARAVENLKRALSSPELELQYRAKALQQLELYTRKLPLPRPASHELAPPPRAK